MANTGHSDKVLGGYHQQETKREPHAYDAWAIGRILECSVRLGFCLPGRKSILGREGSPGFAFSLGDTFSRGTYSIIATNPIYCTIYVEHAVVLAAVSTVVPVVDSDVDEALDQAIDQDVDSGVDQDVDSGVDQDVDQEVVSEVEQAVDSVLVQAGV
ncbi:hypothetical protein Q9L58_008327 [Maublancomyces gigas]|uniref:Uncharacterized protein n=1 Tax=Discina gigas TaxID=1032678 RepID=A0ABR3G9Z6_9PEZI